MAKISKSETIFNVEQASQMKGISSNFTRTKIQIPQFSSKSIFPSENVFWKQNSSINEKIHAVFKIQTLKVKRKKCQPNIYNRKYNLKHIH